MSAIYVMNADGTHLRRLTPRSMDASNPRWSREGTRIAFNDYAEDVSNKSANVYTIRPDGTSLQKVTHYTGGTKRAFVNDWSPTPGRSCTTSSATPSTTSMLSTQTGRTSTR